MFIHNTTATHGADAAAVRVGAAVRSASVVGAQEAAHT
jgi:hypothetical protein